MKHRSLFANGWTAVIFATLLALAGCNGAGGSSTGAVTISHAVAQTLPLTSLSPATDKPATAAMLPLQVNAMHVRFLDERGNLVYGPVEVQATSEVSVRDVPLSATVAKVDYLRNGGYALHTGDEPITWNGLVGTVAPQPVPAAESTSRWTATVDANGVSRITVRAGSNPNAQAEEFLIRGVAYSPAPIGYSNKNGPGFGDLFWDTPGGFLDFERVWKRDIETIRSLGFNTVRTYSLIANFINNDGSIPRREQITQPGSLLVRQHTKFLDEAWNNGHNPIFVIVGIPMPDLIYVKPSFDNPGNANAIRFWDDNFTATVQQLKNHPAVIGFTIFNEIGGQPDYYSDATRATHYWGQVKKYSERAKSIAPDKLVGWAFNDDPVFASSTVEYRKRFAQAIDFYGVNAFQAEQLNSTLDPWKATLQGSAARPVILTEFGLPATGRRDTSTVKPYVEPGLATARNTIAAREGVAASAVMPPSTDVNFLNLFTRNSEASVLSIYADETTIKKTAQAVGRLIPEAFKASIVAGLVYFEWSDEWWKQDAYVDFLLTSQGNRAVSLVTLRIDRQEGTGATAIAFPNGYWDEEGFGLNAIALDRRSADQVYTDNMGGVGANVQVDRLTPRKELVDTVVNAFRNAEGTRRSALSAR